MADMMKFMQTKNCESQFLGALYQSSYPASSVHLVEVSAHLVEVSTQQIKVAIA